MKDPRSADTAYSLVEILVVVAVIAVMAAIAIPVVNDMRRGTALATANYNLGLLNDAVNAYNNAISRMPVGLSTDDVVARLRLPMPDSSPPIPFLKTDKSFPTNSDINTYRASWGGRYFQLLEPGLPGAGVDLQR